MRVNLVRKENLITKKWSGGTTTELFIYPQTSSYEKRNFNIRISSAECRDKESVFTDLPGIRRKLMVLGGKIQLKHEGAETVELEPYKVDIFDGGVRTTSEGTCTDFNLMLKGDYDGDIYQIEMDDKENGIDTKSVFFCCIYVLSGELVIKSTREEVTTCEGDFCVLSDYDQSRLLLTATDKKASAVITVIYKKRR